MLATLTQVEELAERIERAYRLQRPDWCEMSSSAGVWSVAAKVLLASCENAPDLPLDPELFVSAQPRVDRYPEPWNEFTRPEASLHYRKLVAEIVRCLRVELTGEVRRAETLLATGRSLAQVLGSKKRGISPLGCYIVAHRAGRSAFAKRFLSAAVAQHQACPLYRQASTVLLAASAYPVSGDADDRSRSFPTPRAAFAAYLN